MHVTWKTLKFEEISGITITKKVNVADLPVPIMEIFLRFIKGNCKIIKIPHGESKWQLG
jgi:hypothetical protein